MKSDIILKRIITWPFRYIKWTIRVLVRVVLAPILIAADLILYLSYRMIVGGLAGDGVRPEIGAAMGRWKGWLADLVRGAVKLAGGGE